MRFYRETDKMHELICDEPALLQMMCRFDIPLGIGEKSIQEVCEENGVDTSTFLAVANFMKGGENTASSFVQGVSVTSLMGYLKKAHVYFLDFQLPSIRRKLLEAIDCSVRNEISFLILKFYDGYMGEVRKHMEHENKKVFAYVERLIAGVRSADFEIEQFAKSHVGIDKKLQELKNIIIKYYTASDQPDLLHSVLFDIFNCEKDLRLHCEVEDLLFVPAVQLLEKQVAITDCRQLDSGEVSSESLSEREREIVAAVVRGMTNKQIADRLFISVNTVLTHRKNITRKLNIRSVSGLTIYAIVNNIVDMKELDLNTMG